MDSGLDKTDTRTATMAVRLGVIRDGTPGITLCLGIERIGEWTDSRAVTLSLTEDNKIRIEGASGKLLYLFSAPGKVVGGHAASGKEAILTFEL